MPALVPLLITSQAYSAQDLQLASTAPSNTLPSGHQDGVKHCTTGCLLSRDYVMVNSEWGWGGTHDLLRGTSAWAGQLP